MEILELVKGEVWGGLPGAHGYPVMELLEGDGADAPTAYHIGGGIIPHHPEAMVRSQAQLFEYQLEISGVGFVGPHLLRGDHGIKGFLQVKVGELAQLNVGGQVCDNGDGDVVVAEIL